MILRNVKSITHRPLKAKTPNKCQIVQLVILSAALNLLLEVLSRRSLIEGMSFITETPYTFFYNMLIILMTLSVSLLFTRMNFIVILLSSVWVGLGITNFVILGFRTTPLAAIDFIILKSVIGIVPFYLSIYELILITFICAAAFGSLVLAWRKSPRHQVFFGRTVIALSLTIILLFTLPGISATSLGNLVDAYNEYGFAYCFATSVIDRGIEEPKEYSQENIDQILALIQSDTNNPNLTPNIIMLQLECFFDVNYLLNLELSKNPLPNFTKLKSDFSSGFLTVPSIGAGTANTEFEVISGMNLEYFGFGEYPYKTILKSSTTETLGYNLSELGYHNHAVHNNTGIFYDRNNVFANLGFNNFSSIEYMNDVEYNSIGWAKDSILTTEIIKAMDATTTQDFIYAISVQAHGKYPDLAVDENQRIKVIGNPDEREANAHEYFVNQIYEMDLFLGELTSVLSNYKEPVVLVMFGDHLPSLSIEDEDLKNGDRFQTEYVIWSNFPMSQIKRDLTTYQLGAYVMERLGMNNGLLTKFHQIYSDKESYQDKLVMLQYDLLYGNMYAYGGTNPYLTTELQMGTTKIEITEVSQIHGSIFIDGEGFTPWSRVYIDEKAVDTLYIDQNTVLVADKRLNNGSRVFVAQISDNGRMLSQTAEWIVQKDGPLGANGHIPNPPK